MAPKMSRPIAMDDHVRTIYYPKCLISNEKGFTNRPIAVNPSVPARIKPEPGRIETLVKSSERVSLTEKVERVCEKVSYFSLTSYSIICFRLE